jgi:AhpD family alkylhydroperoxidase
MQTRIAFTPAKFGAAIKAMLGLNATVRDSGLEKSLLHLVRMRVSQINGCGHCLDMHSKEARAAGESEQRLYLLSVWREAPMFTERERAALAWSEAVTKLSDQRVPDEIYSQIVAVFNETEIAALTLAIVEINGWNRFSIAFNTVPGSYRVGQHAA